MSKGNGVFVLPDHINEITRLSQSVSTVVGADIKINPACIFFQDRNGRFKHKALSVHGVELEDGVVTDSSMIAFSMKGESEATSQLALRYFMDKIQLLTAVKKLIPAGMAVGG